VLLELLGRRVPIEGWFDGEDHTIVQLELIPGDPHDTPVSHMILSSFRSYLQVLGEFLSFFQGSRKLLQPPSFRGLFEVSPLVVSLTLRRMIALGSLGS